MPAVLASDIRKRYQKKNNNKNKKKEKATDKKVASSSSTPKPAVKGVQSKSKSTTPSKNKPALKPGKAKSSVDKVGKAAGYALGIAPKNQRNARDIQQYQKARDEYRDYRDSSVRKSYELRRKNTGEYANKVNRAHVRGFSYDNNPDNQSYFLKQAAAGAWSVPEGIGKAVESLSSDAAKGEQAKLNPRGGRYSQNVLDVRERARKNNQLNGDRYERFTDELNKDVRSGTLASQVAQGLGRMLPTMPLYAVGAGGALANLGKVNKATKAISTLAKPMSTAGAAVNTAAYYGERYDEAIKNGATPEQARKAALAYALPTAYLEGMGGAEKAFSKAIKPGINPLKTAVKSGLSEGLEEVAQTPWEEYTKKAYGADIPLFGRGSQEAVFNPDQLANAFTVGAALGAAGGGVAGIRTNTDVRALKNAWREEYWRQAQQTEEAIKDAFKAGAYTKEQFNEALKTKNKVVKQAIKDKMKEIDEQAKRYLRSENDTEVAAYANTNDEDGYSYNAPDVNEETDNQIGGGYDYGNAVEPPRIETNINQPVQNENRTDQENDDLMDEEERLYGEQEFGIKPRPKRTQEETPVNEQPNSTDNQFTNPSYNSHLEKIRESTRNLKAMYNIAGEQENVDSIGRLVEESDPDFILPDKQTDAWAINKAANNLSYNDDGSEVQTIDEAYTKIESQITRNGNRGNKVIDAELAILAQEADREKDYAVLENIWRLHTTLGSEAAREMQGRRIMRMLTPFGKTMVDQAQGRQLTAKSRGFDALDVKEQIEGRKANGSSNLQTAINDFADSDISDDVVAEPSKKADGFLAKKIGRRRKVNRIIDKSGKAYDSKSLRKKIEADVAKEEARKERQRKLNELGIDESDIALEQSEEQTAKTPKFKKPGFSILLDRYEKELRKALKLNPKTEKLIVKYPKIKDIIRDVMRENPPNLKEALVENDINKASLFLSQYVANRVRLDTDFLIDQRRNEKAGRGERYGEANIDDELDSLIFDYVYKNIAERMRKLREREITNLLRGTGKAERADKKKYNFIEDFLYFNNLGLLDDPAMANRVYKAMSIPFISEEEKAAMIRLHELADEVRKPVEDGGIESIENEDVLNIALESKHIDKLKIINNRLKTDEREYAAKALDQLAQKVVEDKLVGNNWQKTRQWQIISMLLNPRTWIRNIAPNSAMLPLNQAGRIAGSLADKRLNKRWDTGARLMGMPTNPKQTLINMGRGFRYAWDDLLLGIDTTSNNKTELQIRNAFNNNTRAGKIGNSLANLTGFGLKMGDLPFENAYREQALQGMKKINPDMDEPSELMNEIAQLEAMRNTFKDENKFTDITQSVVDALNKAGGGAGTWGFGSVLIPFVRTPANLTKMMVDYSPPGAFIESISSYYKFRNAVDPEEKLRLQYQFANNISHFVSGTLLAFFITVLKQANLIEITGGTGEDDWQKAKYEEQVHGKQEYAIRIGDHWYNYNNLQPIGSLMAMAVDTANFVFNPEDVGFRNEGIFIERLLFGAINGLINAGEMLYESSVYKGIGDLFKGKDDIASAIANLAASVPQQMTPAFIQQAARVIDPWQRDTTSSIEDPFFRTLDEGRNKLTSNLPGLSYLLPKRTDAYGLPMERFDGNTAGDIVNAFINPFTTTKDKAGNFSGLNKKTANAYAESIEYIEKLDSMFPDKNLLPQSAGRTIKINGEYVRLTGDERQQWQKDSGGKLLKDVTALLKTKDFNSLSEGQQATVIGNTLAAYKEQAKHAIANAKKLIHNIDSKFSKPLGAEDVGQSVGEYYTQIQRMNNAFMPEDERKEGEEYFTKSDYKRYYAFKKFDDGEWDEDQVVYYLKAADVLSDKWEDEMDAAEKQGISNINFLKAKEQMTTLSNDRNLEAKERDLMAYNIAMEYGENDDQRQWLLTTLSNMGYWVPSNGTKEIVFDGSGEEMIAGLADTCKTAWNGTSNYCAGVSGRDIFDSPQQFVMAINTVYEMTDSNKKDDKVAAIDQFNLTANQKKAVLAACNNQSKDVTFHDGGSIEISSEVSTVKKPTLNTGSSAKKSKETTTPSKPATTSTATKTAGTIASQIRQLQNASRGFSSAFSSVAQRTGEKMKNTIDSIMPTKPTTFADAYKTSNFGENRGDHIHAGIDIGVNRQTNIGAVSMTPGTIAYIGKRGGYGNVVEYLANDGHYIIYGHLDSIAKGLKVGQEIKSGTQLGIVGNTGNSDGIHLHLEVRDGSQNGTPVDPETVYDIFGDGIKTASADPNYQASSAYSSSSSSSSSSDSSSGSSGSGRSGGGSSKKKRKPISTGSSYGSYSYGGYTPSSSYSSGYTPGSYTPGSYNP